MIVPWWSFTKTLIAAAALALVRDGVTLGSRLLTTDFLPPDLLAEMTSGWPLGGAIEGRPWRTTAYGLGVMIGTGPEKTRVIGHTVAAGPAAWSRSIIIPTQRCLLPRRPFREAKAELRYKPSRRGRNEVNRPAARSFL